VSLIEYGIFTAQKDMEQFLRKLRASIEHEFVGGVDLSNVFDLNRLEYSILHEIDSETRGK
jgi:hypothetical protein